jgi:hypothetical protein
MALLYMEGFEDNAWNERATTVNGTISGTYSRTTGGRGIRLACNSTACMHIQFPSSSTIYWGAAVRTEDFENSSIKNLTFREGGTTHVNVDFHGSSGTIPVYRNGTLLGTASGFPGPTYVFVEIMVVVDDTNGEIIVRIDNDEKLHLTSVDTRNGGTGVINNVLMGSNSGQQTWFDDIYILDDTGTYNNTFLGDSNIKLIVPNADVTTQWTPSLGSTHYILVDESIPNTIDYISASSTGLRDLFELEDVASSEIFGVDLSAHSRKDDAGAIMQRLVAVSSGSTAFGDTVGVTQSTAFLPIRHFLEADPATSTQWTEAGLNNLQLGIETRSS